ncbi:hypothetical protein ACHAWF_005376 [Thalassiosira exigua]
MLIHRVAIALTLSAVARRGSALDYPIGITNCGVQQWIPSPPKRAVTMNQGTTEIMLALGLEDRMVGTAYMDDYIWPELEEAYKKVPVIAEKYPTIEQLEAVNPDFVYASYGSAFRDGRVNYTDMVAEDECSLVDDQNRSHCREELHNHGIQTYLQKPYCELLEHRPEATTLETLYSEIWDIASIFDVYDSGRKLVDTIDGHFRDAAKVANGDGLPPISVLWLDGWDAEEPFVGACCGSVQTIVEKSGAKHIFDDLGIDDKKSWENVGWEKIVERDPDVIVLVDASWDLAHQKIYELCAHNITRELRAVQNRAFIQVPFSASTLGARIGALSYNLAEGFAALVKGEALPSLQFTDTSLADDGSDSSPQALSKAGARVFEKLPVWNGTDLNEFCPGSNVDIQIRDDIPLKSIEEALQEINDLGAQVEEAQSKATNQAQKNEELQAAQAEAQREAQEKSKMINDLEEEVDRLSEMVVMENTGARNSKVTSLATMAGLGLAMLF